MIIYQCKDCLGQFKGHLMQIKCIFCDSTNIYRADITFSETKKSLSEKTKTKK